MAPLPIAPTAEEPGTGGQLPARYRIVRELGHGGMGVVYEAVDLVESRPVAVKTLMTRHDRDPIAALRFNREGRTASSLSHPNICQVFTTGTHGGRPFIVMELVAGETIRTRLARGGCDGRFVLDVARQVARGLQAAHGKYIIHRDIKPANIMVTPSGLIKILDFGLAKHFVGVESPTAITVTGGGALIGTVDYMSPEQLLGRRLDQRTDFFSLGVLLYEILTGHKPFKSTSAMEAMASILHDAPAPLPTMPCVAEWTRLLDRLLAKDADARYASAEALLADLDSLEQVLAGQTVTWPAVAAPRSVPRRPLMAVMPLTIAAGGSVEERRDLEYFCHGLDEELRTGLMLIDALQVVPPTLVGRAGHATPGRTGRHLHADHVLFGTVQPRGERVAVMVSLHDVRADAVVWSKRYERAPEDLLGLRDAIVSDVGAELHLGQTRSRPSLRLDPRSRHAFQLCLKGRFYWSKRYEGGLQTARQCFEEALRLDPTLAAAHAGMADTHAFLGFYCLVRPRTAFELARASAERALELAPDMAEAHTSIGLVRLGGEWDFDGARRAFERATELDPTYGPNRVYLSWVLVLLGRRDEAHAEAERAQDIDPLAPVLNAGAAYTFFLSRAYERAIRECERALEIDREFLLALYVMAMSKAQLGLLDEAIAEMQHVVAITNGMPFYCALLGKFLGDAGRTDEARAMIARVEAQTAAQYVPPHCWVYIYAGLKDFDRAFEWQDRAFEDGASPFNYLAPVLECLHGDPRFADDLRQWGLQV
jgi:tetratricopeptide (TPR) repeat protein